MSVKDYLQDLIYKSLPSQVSENLNQDEIKLERPNNPGFGDFSSNVAMTSFPGLKDKFKSPRDLASKIKENLEKLDPNIETSIAGPGFINFKIADSFFLKILDELVRGKDNLTKSKKQSQKVIVEYSSPNIAKPFTIGHFRSTIIGDSMANIFESLGYQVFRDNHLGDWGTQFGKQIVAIKKWGDEAALDKSDNPVKDLVELYVKFHQEAEEDASLEDEARACFKKLEDGDEESRRLWQKCIDWSFKEFDRIYARLGVKFTENNGRGYGESFFEPLLKDLIIELKEKGIASEGKGGASLIFFENDKYPPLMIQKGDGATLYATRDLATDKWRLEQKKYRGDNAARPIIVNEVGAEQSLYFQQIYEIEKMLNWYLPEERHHLKHGLFRFKEGKMSTRKGNVIWLTEVLDKAKEKALELTKNEENAEAVGIAALKWNDLKRKAELTVNFDWNEILNLQGNSGPYMLYAYARAKSILRKATEQEIDLKRIEKEEFNKNKLSLSENEKELIKLLNEFSVVIKRAQSDYAPHHLCTYLFNLAQTFNSFYNKQQILDDSTREEDRLMRDFRLKLTTYLALVIKTGLNLLGIKTLERL